MRRFFIHRAAAAAFTRAVATTPGPQRPPPSSSSSGPSNGDIGSTAANVPAGFGMQRAPLSRNAPPTPSSSPPSTTTGQSPSATTKAPPSVTQSQAAALSALHSMMQKDTTCVRLHRELLNAIATGSDADAQDLAGALARHVARHQSGGAASETSTESTSPKTSDTKSSTSSVETAVKKGPSSSEMPPAPGDESLAAIADKTMSMAMKRSPSDPSSSGASTDSMIPLVDVGVLDTAFVDYFSDIVGSATSPGSASQHDDVMHPTHAAASQSALNSTDAPAVPETSPVELDAEKAVSEILQVYLKFFAEDFTALKKEAAAAVCEATAECLALTSTSSSSSPTASDTKLFGSGNSAASLSNSKGKSAMHQSKRTPNVAVHLTPPIATDAAAPAVLREMRQCCPLSVRGRRRPAGMSALKHTTDAKAQLVRFYKSSLFAGRLSDDDRARVMEEAETVRAKLAAKGNNDAAEDIEAIVAELVDVTVDENLTAILADVASTNGSSDPNADVKENVNKSHVARDTAESVAAGGGMRCSVGVHDDYGDLFATTVIDPARLSSVMGGSASQIPNTNSKSGSGSGAEVKEQSVEVDVTKHFGDAVARRVNRWLSRPGAPVVPVGCVVQLRVAVSEPEA